ncbi:MAG: beta galactosidase jelly roll domain-containing protein [Bacteroidales bacterium]|nr:beta galactosidase jelly roll domain-containing protein [Bacteroidales bacterium]
MNRILKAVLCFIVLSLGARAQEIPQIGNVLSREKISLNGNWNYIVDVQEEGYYDYRMNPTSWGFFLNSKPQRPEDLIEYDFDKAPQMQIPSDWNTKDERLFFYEGTVWFKKSFNYKKKQDKKVILYFSAVNYEAYVYLNGKLLGRHEGGFTAFNYDVTDKIKDGENFVIVKVDNKRKAENVPTQIFDWWNYGGITRDVFLIETQDVYIENYCFTLKKVQNTKQKFREIAFSANLNQKLSGKTVEISFPELKLKQSFITDSDGKISGVIKVKTLELWSPENPKLYAAELTLGNTTIKDEIGFRTIETKDKKIILNGKPIFLRGISIHEEKPNGGGRANSVEDAEKLLGWAKELGCNFVRLAHYPHNEYMVRTAEKMGLLVWSEIPVYWTIAWENPATLQNAKNQLKDMILRDQNRANVIIWSIANETPHGQARENFLSQLAQYAKNLDSTRLISMAMEVTSASNFHNKLQDNMNKYVDVISFNQYIGWYRDVNDAPKMTWEIPYNKPVIISEFGGGAKYGYHGEKNQRWTEEFQENLYIQNIAMLDKIDGFAGTTPWILKDFRSPRRVLNDIQDYYNRKGLFSDNGEKKKAFYIMKSWYEKKKQDWK